MTRGERLQRIVSLSRRAERAAADKLGTSQRQLAQYESQLREMLRYREEYRASLKSGTAAPMNGAEVRKLRAFIAQVDAVVHALEEKIRQTNARQAAARESWMQQHRRANALDDVADRATRTEQRSAESREQRDSDDRYGGKRR